MFETNKGEISEEVHDNDGDDDDDDGDDDDDEQHKVHIIECLKPTRVRCLRRSVNAHNQSAPSSSLSSGVSSLFSQLSLFSPTLEICFTEDT